MNPYDDEELPPFRTSAAVRTTSRRSPSAPLPVHVDPTRGDRLSAFINERRGGLVLMTIPVLVGAAAYQWWVSSDGSGSGYNLESESALVALISGLEGYDDLGATNVGNRGAVLLPPNYPDSPASASSQLTPSDEEALATGHATGQLPWRIGPGPDSTSSDGVLGASPASAGRATATESGSQTTTTARSASTRPSTTQPAPTTTSTTKPTTKPAPTTTSTAKPTTTARATTTARPATTARPTTSARRSTSTTRRIPPHPTTTTLANAITFSCEITVGDNRVRIYARPNKNFAMPFRLSPGRTEVTRAAWAKKQWWLELGPDSEHPDSWVRASDVTVRTRSCRKLLKRN